jgi:TPR repeat protein
MAYLYGAAVAEDRQRAMKLFALAAAAQHPKASGWHANDLYNQHMEKTGNQFGTPEARRFMKIAADGGVTSAMALLAAYHEHVEDYAEAARYHRKAADAGAICARYSLSMLYLDGRGVTKDVKHAIELLKADKECSNPIFELADIYTQGKYVPKDYGAAVAAIAHGTLPGHKARAAKLYETGGPGLKADKARALTLYREAVEAGGELFEADVKRLEARRD